MQEPADIWKPALIAGVIFGTCSGIPVLGILNCACCSLVVGSGVLTCFLMVRSGALPVTWGRASLGGALAGAVAALVSSMTNVLVMTAMGTSYEENFQNAVSQVSEVMPSAAEAADIMSRVPAFLFLMIVMIFSLFIYAPFGALGGILGRALFEKRQAPATSSPTDGTPPAPPDPPASGSGFPAS